MFSKRLITCHRSLTSIGQLTMCGTRAEAPWSVGCYSREAEFWAVFLPSACLPPLARFVNSQPGPDLAVQCMLEMKLEFRPRTAADDRELSGSNDMRFLIRKNGVLYKTRKMFQKKTFQNFSSSTHLGIKETIEFLFIAEFITAKMFLVISYMFPTQFPRGIILPQTLVSLRT